MIIRRLGNLPAALGSYHDLEQARHELARLMNTATDLPEDAGVFPRLNVTEDNTNFYVRAELPGVLAEDIELSVEQRTLSIKGHRSATHEKNVSFHRQERLAGDFNRSIVLPANVEPAKVEARHINGLLTVKLPKPEAELPKQIAVKSA